MSTDLLIPICPACGSDRTSDASKGEIYCVDCNRIYSVLEMNSAATEQALPEETVKKAA
jgi:transcription initiation factor TFIIIB Brf1 subunit/transcription initiation factor TFIIB